MSIAIQSRPFPLKSVLRRPFDFLADEEKVESKRGVKIFFGTTKYSALVETLLVKTTLCGEWEN